MRRVATAGAYAGHRFDLHGRQALEMQHDDLPLGDRQFLHGRPEARSLLSLDGVTFLARGGSRFTFEVTRPFASIATTTARRKGDRRVVSDAIHPGALELSPRNRGNAVHSAIAIS